MGSIARQSWRFASFLFDNFKKDDCQLTAAALTYQTLFAVVPLLTVTYTVLASFDAFQGVGETLEGFIFENVVPENVAVVQEYLRGFSDQARSLRVPSLLLLAVTAFLMMFTIERTFNRIWLVQEPRHGFQRVLVYWAILTLGPILVGGGIFITTYIFSLPLISDVAGSPAFLHLVPLGLSAIMFTVMYITIPNCVVPLRHGVAGGVVIAAVFELAKQLFGEVVSRFGFEVIYGAFAAVPLFLLWIYLSWIIVLLGAEFVKGLGLFRFERNGRLELPLIQILVILELFFHAHHKGEVVTEKNIRSHGHRIDMEMWPEYKRRLMKLGLIRGVDRGGLVLSKNLSEVTIWDLYQALPWQLPGELDDPAENWESSISSSLRQVFDNSEKLLRTDLGALFKSKGEA